MKATKLLPLILSICLLTPLANDIFIPSLPVINHEFNTTHAQLMVTMFMLGMAVTMLMIGPLMDRFGRKPILLSGLIIFLIASVLITFASSFHLILFGRFLQAIGAASFVPGAMSIARDKYSHEQLSTVIPLIMGCIVVMPCIAPIIGSLMQIHFAWEGNFVLCTFLATIYILLFVFFFKETLSEKNHHAIHPKHLLVNYLELFSHLKYILLILSAAGVYGIIFGYISAAPFLLIHDLHVNVVIFSLYFALFAAVIAICSFAIPLLKKRLALRTVSLIGAIILLFGTLLFIILNALHFTVLNIVLPMAFIAMGIGLIRPTAVTLALQIFPPKKAGINSAVINFTAFIFGTISTGVISLLPSTIFYFSLVLGTLTIFAVLCSVTSYLLK
jgi:DHA1 family bicyclomycin/chloramphenicol resistance-like MFS transporter